MIFRHDFKRNDIIELNGEWDFCFDKKINKETINGNFNDYIINVPYPYQSKLSGVIDKSHHDVMWYHKKINLTKQDLSNSLILKIGAVDSFSSIYVNGQHIKDHEGGYSQIDVDITNYVVEGENNIVIYAKDDRNTDKPRGKQYWKDKPDRCWYQEASGITSNVWIEKTGKYYLNYFRILPDIDSHSIQLDAYFNDNVSGIFQIIISYKNQVNKKLALVLNNKRYIKEVITLNYIDEIDEVSYWNVDSPNLYDISFEIISNHKTCDLVQSYFGLRNIEIKDNQIYLNHKPIYQRLILQQGYFSDTLTTPTNEEAIIRDLTLIKKMGFNGIRMHQKNEDPLFYYHADRLGLLVWLEMPSSYTFNLNSINNNFDEWKQIVLQNINHPSIITYVPINESWGVRKIYSNQEQINFVNAIYAYTKALDPSRIISTNDGWEFSSDTDIYGFHQYFADPEVFENNYLDWDKVSKLGMWNRPLETNKPLQNKPILVSEFGGIALENDNKEAWGYNGNAKNKEELKQKIKQHVDAVLSLDYICGYCYTQFSDVMQEINGLVTMDRTPKLSLEDYYEIFSRNPIKYQK